MPKQFNHQQSNEDILKEIELNRALIAKLKERSEEQDQQITELEMRIEYLHEFAERKLN